MGIVVGSTAAALSQETKKNTHTHRVETLVKSAAVHRWSGKLKGEIRQEKKTKKRKTAGKCSIFLLAKAKQKFFHGFLYYKPFKHGVTLSEINKK